MLKLENQVLEDLLELHRTATAAISNSTYVIPLMKELASEFINMTFGWTSIVQNVGMLRRGSESYKCTEHHRTIDGWSENCVGIKHKLIFHDS
ncbi:unnamed protein product [Prunus armeniaca]